MINASTCIDVGENEKGYLYPINVTKRFTLADNFLNIFLELENVKNDLPLNITIFNKGKIVHSLVVTFLPRRTASEVVRYNAQESAEYCNKKCTRNIQHDKQITSVFESRGSTVLRIWECELKRDTHKLLVHLTLAGIKFNEHFTLCWYQS